MDGMQFGRWIGEQRRAHGLTSQRALIDAVERDTVLCQAGVSEDFIARLEAGQLVYPFRGRVRRRVLLLSRLVCASPRELQSYLHAAALAHLSPGEEEEIASVRAYLAPQAAAPPHVLPRRPTLLVGRSAALAELTQALMSPEANICCVTGMPGVGKSALAYETAHVLAGDEQSWLQRFPDGVVVFTCAGRQGSRGLAALLDDILAVFADGTGARRNASRSRNGKDSVSLAHTVDARSDGLEEEPALAQTLARVRQIMANRRALIVLDGLGPHLPLGLALDALLAPSYSSHSARTPGRIMQSGNVVLTTSRHFPVPTAHAYRLSLDPLTSAAASELFMRVLSYPLDSQDAHWVEAICSALGYLPLAVELAAVTVAVRRIPLPVLAARLQEHPLDRILDVDGELHARIAAALVSVDTSARQQFALLSALDSETFSLEAAAALSATNRRGCSHPRLDTSTTTNSNGDADGPVWWGLTALGQVDGGRAEREATADLAQAAADLGELVQHSLLEPVPDLPHTAIGQHTSTAASEAVVSAEQARYRIHPVLRAHASEQLDALATGAGERAARLAQEFAIGYAQRHRGDQSLLERERDLLVAALLAMEEAGRHGQARDLALNLRGVIGRRGVDPAGERALLVAARAAHELGDHHGMIRFLYRLGTLHYYRGAYDSARRIWEDALSYSEGLGDLPYTRLPVRGLGMLAEACGEREEALRYTAAYKQACLDEGDRFALAGGQISHAFQLRIMGRKNESLEEASACLEIVLPADHGAATPYEHIVAIEAQMELARLTSDYERAQALTEECVALNQRYRDHFMGVECLVDQAEFAFGLGEQPDAQALAYGAVDLAAAIGAVGQQSRARALLARF
jgi:hypothetical protein